MAHAAIDATFESVSAGGLGDEFDGDGVALLDLPAILRRSEDEAGRSGLVGAVRDEGDFEAVIVVGGGDFELNFLAFLDVQGRRREFVLLGGHFDDLSGLILLSGA